MKTTFITYGTSNYALQKKHLLNLADKSRFFDESYSFGPRDISPEFYNKHKEVFQFKKGGGYWIWKFQIIKQHFLALVILLVLLSHFLSIDGIDYSIFLIY